jgi:hypothetical protein
VGPIPVSIGERYYKTRRFPDRHSITQSWPRLGPSVSYTSSVADVTVRRRAVSKAVPRVSGSVEPMLGQLRPCRLSSGRIDG